MSSLKLSVPKTDYDAAQALLELQNDSHNNQRVDKSVMELRENMEDTANLFLSCFITSNVAKTVNNRVINQTVDTFEKIVIKSENDYHNKVTGSVNKRSRIFKRRPTKLIQNLPQKTKINNCSMSPQVKTCNVSTQTENGYSISNIEIMEGTIRKLYEKIQMLESRIKESNTNKDSSHTLNSHNKTYNHSDEMDSEDYELDDVIDEDNENVAESFIDEVYESPAKKLASSNILRSYNKNVSATNDLMPIGEGHALIPSRLFRHINWNSYTSATRKLLTAVFSRRILATHSLTGKPSPAFPNKPAKKKLDPALVNDIVQTVVEKCCVPENVVRTSITTKCADESKMYRTRQKNTRKRKQKTNRENVPPDTTSNSDD